MKRLFLCYMDPKSDDDKFGIIANSEKLEELVGFVKDDLEIIYIGNDIESEIDSFINEILEAGEEYIFEFEGRKHHYKILEESW